MGIVAVERDVELDTVAVGFGHEFVQLVQDCVIK
jgi:hypothetical protein